MTRGLSTVAAILLTVGCTEDKPIPTVRLEVRVVGSEGQPLEGSAVFINEAKVGKTDADGSHSTPVRGPEGRQVSVLVTCPEGFVLENDQPHRLAVRFLTPVTSPREAEPLPLQTTFACSPLSQSFVLLVTTNGQPDLPVVVHGNPIAATDSEGVTQVVLDEAPGREIEVVLDTSGRPELRPAMPSRRLITPKTRQILIFDQVFKQAKRKRTKRRGQRRILGPRRI